MSHSHPIHRDHSIGCTIVLLQMPGHVPSGLEQVVGHLNAGVGVGLAPPASGAGGIVTLVGVPSANGVGIASGVMFGSGSGN